MANGKIERVKDITVRHHLEDSDACFSFYEHKSFETHRQCNDDGNQLIRNLKKSLSRRGMPEFKYKGIAINQCSDLIKDITFLNKEIIPLWVPIPPSKCKSDPDHDDRLIQILSKANVQYAEIISQSESYAASHEGRRMRPDQLLNIYQIQSSVELEKYNMIILFDDVLTQGAHFRACKDLLSSAYPGMPVIGIFIAHTIWIKDIVFDTV